MTMDMKRGELHESLKMSHIEMKRDIVEETCVIEGMLMVEIDIEVHLIMMKMVIYVLQQTVRYLTNGKKNDSSRTV